MKRPKLKKRKTGAVVKVGLIQMRAEESPAKNLERTETRIREAAQKGAQIICLQELFRSPYFPQTEEAKGFHLAEPVPGPTTERLSKLAKAEKIVLIVPLFEKRAHGIYHNTVAVIDADGRLLGKYRKMHIPDDPGFYEKYYFTPGDLGFQIFKTRYAVISPLICWDQWFPEAARLVALKGAQIIFYPTAIGWNVRDSERDKKEAESAWETIQRSHAISNGVYVASANRVGIEENLCFWGHSFVSDPFGNVVAQAGNQREEILVVPCDLSKIDQTRSYWPFLRDRRIDAYEKITSRYLAA